MRRRSFIGAALVAASGFSALKKAGSEPTDAPVIRRAAEKNFVPSHSRRKGVMKVRRVVTGHNAAGKAVFASDSPVDGITVTLIPGLEIHNIWGADETPTFPDDGSKPKASAYFPPVPGFRFGLITIPPDSVKPATDLDMQAGVAEMERKLPGLSSHFEPDHPGMHRTDSIDYQYVISGEVWLELDDGKQVHLRPGDTVVQNGTRHAWHNKGTIPCQMVFCLVGAQRRNS